MANDFVEVIVVVSAAPDRRLVEEWFAKRELSLTPMRAGYLATGNVRAIEKAFGVSVRDIRGTVELPIPGRLRNLITSVAIREPPRYTTQ